MFDGRKKAAEIEAELVKRVARLKHSLMLTIVLYGQEEASIKYVQKKKEVGERLGIEVKVVSPEGYNLKGLGGDGLMVQLPVSGLDKEKTLELLEQIPVNKDVDGLNPKNIERMDLGKETFLPATVMAVERVMEEARVRAGAIIGVAGAKGMVGRPLVKRLKWLGFDVLEFDQGDQLDGLKGCDVIISATGQAEIIKKKYVNIGFTAIDIGFPKAEFTKEALDKAGFWTPVPGGVGPLTVVSLMENVVTAGERRDRRLRRGAWQRIIRGWSS